MAWVVDTCLVIDVLDADPEFGHKSAELLDRRVQEDLVLCPLSYVELSPAFLGETSREDEFLAGVGISWLDGWQWADTVAAHRAWNRHVERRRSAKSRRRPVADVLIGAFACRHQGLLTRNAEDFAELFPGLMIVVPD